MSAPLNLEELKVFRNRQSQTQLAIYIVMFIVIFFQLGFQKYDGLVTSLMIVSATLIIRSTVNMRYVDLINRLKYGGETKND